MEVTIHSGRMTRQASMLERLATTGTALALRSGSCGDFSVPNRPISGEPEDPRFARPGNRYSRSR
jgi:hypothetical protein